MKRSQSPDLEIQLKSSQDVQDAAQEASSRLAEDHAKANAKTLQTPFEDTRASRSLPFIFYTKQNLTWTL